MAFKTNILFDVISNILCNKSEELFEQHINSEHFAEASRFMVLRYMTMSYDSRVRDLVLDNYATLERMPEKTVYKWLLMNVPKQKNGFIRYIR